MLATQRAEILDFNNLSRTEISHLLQQYQLVLSVDEALTIQNTILKRPLSLTEAILWSIQGSEHCSYKSSRKHLKKMVTDGPNVILGAKEDAGIVSVAQDKQGLRYGIVISHESHNHPSQIVPYEGAATGVGGNVRDVCCMGAEVIAIGDSLRFGALNAPKTRWIHEGVTAGIAGYGNPIGVPNLAGDVYYDAGYNDNCLVTVVTLGLVREDKVIHSYTPKNAEDYLFILVGKPTDNSGFGGASFASTDLSEEQQERNKGAVQEPNAFLKRHLLKANYALFEKLQERKCIDRVGFKDLGAGGIACASVEMAESGGYGAEIYLDLVPTSMKQLHPSVILCSETQERFMWVVPPELSELILEHYNKTFALPEISAGAQAKIIGKIRSDGNYVVYDHQARIVDAPAREITKGLLYDRPYQRPSKVLMEPKLPLPSDFNSLLLKLLAHENIASRAPIFEKYDKQVQGRTFLEAGEADAGVMQPFNEDKYPKEIRRTGIALSLDQCPRYNKIDPYWGAVNAVVEAARNVAAVGATPQAITDCLCFGNPENPEQMWEFTEAVRGIIDACAAIGLKDFPGASLPIISGNVSFYNESHATAIPPSPMISCLGSLPDIRKVISRHFQLSGSLLLLIGERQDECGGSSYYELHEVLGAKLPKPRLEQIGKELQALFDLIQNGLALAAHDISKGGLAVALAKMSFKNNLGFKVEIPGTLALDKKLFSETGGFILEIKRDHLAAVQALFKKHQLSFSILGETQTLPRLQIENYLDTEIEAAKLAFENGLREKLL
jgi:phosphoribosylformylglycinamidine synthase II